MTLEIYEKDQNFENEGENILFSSTLRSSIDQSLEKNKDLISKRMILQDQLKDFNSEIIKYINIAREHPTEFVKYILNQLDYIMYNDNEDKESSSYNDHKEVKYLFIKKGICKIGLINGKKSFLEQAQRMSIQESLSPLEYDEEITIHVPDQQEIWVDRDFMQMFVEEKISFLNYEHFGFHLDLGTVDPLTSVILQIVDENLFNNQRRNNIFNPNYKKIAISNLKLDNKFCVYISFAG